MTKDKIIDIIVKHEPYKRYCKKLCGGADIHNDLYQEFFLFMFEKSEAELIKLYTEKNLQVYCLMVILNKSRERNRFSGGKDGNPLLSISDFHVSKMDRITNVNHVSHVEGNFDKLFKYLNSDQTLKQEDVAVLFESVDTSLINISKASGVPYITLKVKQGKLKRKIKEHVKI